jgi:pyridoxamine 5'-phosphate oxidase
MSSDDIFKGVRKEYERGALDEASSNSDPFAQFKIWFDDALRSGQEEPNACALATTGQDGQPSVRMVLLKSFKEAGFTFFTNYLSRKGQQLTSNPKASLLFYWPSLERQIRIEGICEKVSAADTDAYFYSRPKGSQLGAAVSLQSDVVASRAVIEDAYRKLESDVGDGRVSRPEGWGGYRLVPHTFEFWQGRESRLHDRLRYEKNASAWRVSRLWP